MKDKKTLNIVLSICITMCALICTVLVISALASSYLIIPTDIEKNINWRIGGPIIGFAGIGGLLALIKIFVCSWNVRKSNKAIGTIVVLCDVLVICGLSMIASAIGILDNDIGASKYNQAISSVAVLLAVGAPTMLMGAIGSWITVKQAAK